MKRSCTPCIGMTIQVYILHTGEKRISHATEFLVTHTGMSRKMAPMGKKMDKARWAGEDASLVDLCHWTHDNFSSPVDEVLLNEIRQPPLRIKRTQVHERIAPQPLICPWEVLSHWGTYEFPGLWGSTVEIMSIYSQEVRGGSITLRGKQVLSFHMTHPPCENWIYLQYVTRTWVKSRRVGASFFKELSKPSHVISFLHSWWPWFQLGGLQLPWIHSHKSSKVEQPSPLISCCCCSPLSIHGASWYQLIKWKCMVSSHTR